ncbi:MAG: tetratricopeptide repeat protein [Pirellulales bacterium]|nr:tetratricopeptide repeat protein [Pirellulales bacterium]
MYALALFMMLAPTDVSSEVDARGQGFAAAESLFRQGEYRDAGIRFASLYESARDGTRPADRLIVIRHAQCLAHEQSWQAAADVASSAMHGEWNEQLRAELHYVLGRCRTAEASYNAARERYLEVTRSSHASATLKNRALWMIAYGDAATGDLTAAREMFERIEKQSRDANFAARALIEAGRCSERAGDWQAAKATYQQVVAKYPAAISNGETHRRLAVVETRLSHSATR